MRNERFIISESSEEYHSKSRSGEFLSSHMLGDFRKCPELYHRKLTGKIQDEDRPAYVIGRAAHCLILEGGEEFAKQYNVDEPINVRTGKPYGKSSQAYQDWLASQDREVISPSDFDFIKRLQVAVWLHSEAAKLLDKGTAEGVVRASYNEMPCQIRMDFFNLETGLIDLKTCDDLTWFEADSRRYGYIHQLAFYRAILREASGKVFPVHIIAVEKREPFRVGVWRVAGESFDYAEKENEAAINRLKKCRADNVWPTGYEEIRILNNI